MKSKRIERNLEKRLYMIRRLQREISTWYRHAISNHQPFPDLLHNLKIRVYDTEDYLRIGNEGRAAVHGFADAWFHRLHTEEVEWVHWYNGEFVGKNLPYGENFKQELVESSHVYKGSQDKLN